MYNSVAFADFYTDTVKTKDEAISLLETPKYRHSLSPLVSTAEVGFYPNGELRIGSESRRITRVGLEQLCKHLGIPNPFARKIPIDLLSTNICELGVDRDKPIRFVIRESDGAVVGVVKHKYVFVPSLDLIQRIGDNILNGKSNRDISISTGGIRITYSMPADVSVEPEVGDIIRFGKEVINSEIGYRKLQAKLLIFRLVCSNGAIAPVCFGQVVEHQIGDDDSSNTILNRFIKHYNKFGSRFDMFKDAFHAMRTHNVTEDDFVKFGRSLDGIIRSPEYGDFEGADPTDSSMKNIGFDLLGVPDYPEMIKRVSKRTRLMKENPFGDIEPSPTIPDLTYYELYNKVTALPHKFHRDFLRRMEVEKLGGKIIEHVVKNFGRN